MPNRLAEIVRRKRGMVLPEMDLRQPMQLPEQDYTDHSPQLSEADIAGVGGDEPGISIQSWRTGDTEADPDAVEVSEPVVRAGARQDEPSAMATQVTPLEPTINSVTPMPDRRTQLLAAIQRSQQAPATEAEDKIAADPFTVNGEVAKLATGAARGAAAVPPVPAADPQVDERALRSEMWDAQEADRKSALTAGMERAGRQLVGAITRTSVPEGIGAAPSQVPGAKYSAETRRKAVADAIARKRQAALDASTMDLHASEAEKNRRLPADKVAQPTSNRTEEDRLRAEKLKLERDKFEAKSKPRAGGGASSDFESNVAAIANYDRDPPTPKQDPGGHIMAGVRRLNPKWNQAEYDAYKHARTNQATNPHLNSAQASREHLDELKAAVAEEDAGLMDNPTANSMARGIAEKSGKATYTRKVTAAKVVGAEIAGALDENDKEGKAMVQRLVDPDQSKEQWAVSLKTLEKLRDEKLGIYAQRAAKPGSNPSGTPDIPKASPGAGYTRAKVNGQLGWYNKATQDWEPDNG